MASRRFATFDQKTVSMQADFNPVPPVLNYSEIETQLRRLEYRLIILSLIQGQGRPYLNRMERMQYQDICHQLDSAVTNEQEANAASRTKRQQSEIGKWLNRFRLALSSLDAEPCDLDAQHDLQETGRQLIPLIRQQLELTPAS